MSFIGVKYQTKCRACGTLNDQSLLNIPGEAPIQITSVMSKKINTTLEYHCEKCNTKTEQDLKMPYTILQRQA